MLILSYQMGHVSVILAKYLIMEVDHEGPRETSSEWNAQCWPSTGFTAATCSVSQPDRSKVNFYLVFI